MKYSVTRRDVNGRSDFLLKCQWGCASTMVCKLDERMHSEQPEQ